MGPGPFLRRSNQSKDLGLMLDVIRNGLLVRDADGGLREMENGRVTLARETQVLYLH